MTRPVASPAFKLDVCAAFIVLAATSTLVHAAEPEIRLFVAKTGNDAATAHLPNSTGLAKDGPVASLQQAITLIETAREGPPANCVISVDRGDYEILQTIEVTAKTMSRCKKLVIEAAKGAGTVTLKGTSELSPILGAEGVTTVDLTRSSYGGKRIPALFWNDTLLTPARYPNSSESPQRSWLDIQQVDPAASSKRDFTVKSEDVRPSLADDGTEVVVFAKYNWVNDVLPIASYDTSSRRLSLKADASYPLDRGSRYFIQNSLRELDSPGEWFFDQKAKRLSLIAPNKGKGVLGILHLGTFIRLTNVSNVTLRNLNFFGSDGSAISVQNSLDCALNHLSIRFPAQHGKGVYGIDVNGGKRIRVSSNSIFDSGGGGIRLTGGTQETREGADHIAEFNRVERPGRIFKQGVGIEVSGDGSTVRQNYIAQTPRMAILLSGSDHLVEKNLIEHANLETADSGAIYVVGRTGLNGWGIRIHANEISDSVGYGFDPQKAQWRSPYFAFGIYLDDVSNGVEVDGNLIRESSRSFLPPDWRKG